MSSIIADEETGLEKETGATTVPSEEVSEEQGVKAYQKLQGENDQLKSQSERIQKEYEAYKSVQGPKEQFYDAFQKNPEWGSIAEKAIREHESTGFNPEEDFVPEEAYQRGTPSYKHRINETKMQIKEAVDTALGGFREERMTDQAKEKLVADGMSRDIAGEFLEFLHDPEKYPGGRDLLMGTMAKAFTQFKSGPTNDAAVEAQVTQEAFPSAGALSGGVEAPRSEVDKKMDMIMAVGEKRSILVNPM